MVSDIVPPSVRQVGERRVRAAVTPYHRSTARKRQRVSVAPCSGNPGGMARAIWSGSIVFGLVNAPVRLYSAIDEHDPDLHLIHVKDGSRIGYQKICKQEDKPVPEDEIAKGHETNGKVVLLADEDFAAARGEGTHTIEIGESVPHDGIDPIYFERSYYVGPQDGAEKVYRLLVEAMEA